MRRSAFFVIRIFLPVLLLAGARNACAQNLPRTEVNKLLNSLRRMAADTSRLTVYIKLARFHVWKPGSFKPDMDSCKYYLDQATILNTKLNSVFHFGGIQLIRSYYFSEQGQYKIAEKVLDESINAFITAKNSAWLGEAYYSKSFYYDAKHRVYWVEQSLAEYREAKDLKHQADCLLLLADLNYVNKNSTEKTSALLDSAAAKYKAINFRNTAGLEVLYAKNYFMKGFHTLAVRSLMSSLRTSESLKDSSRLCEIFDLIGYAYKNLHEDEKAVFYFKNALHIAELSFSNQDVYDVLYDLTDVYVHMGKADSALAFVTRDEKRFSIKDEHTRLNYLGTKLRIYTALKKYATADKFFKKLGPLMAPDVKLKEDWSQVNQIMTEYCLETKQYALAQELLNIHDELVTAFSRTRHTVSDYILRMRLDTAKKNYQSAVTNFIKLNQLKDSTYALAGDRQFQELQLSYETEKKSNEIKLSKQQIMVLTQEKKLQQASLQKAELIRNITIGGIVLLVLTGFLFYRQVQHRQQASQTIERKNRQLETLLSEKEWLLKEVHHRVKNNLHTVMCLLESQAEYLHNDALLAIENSKHRIYAMSLIHQQLYQALDLKTIDMNVYLPEFISYLEGSFSNADRIRFNIDVDPVSLSVTYAIPIALIVNEAVTNAIKHAFPGNCRGEIAIKLNRHQKKVILTICDNGIGIPIEKMKGTSDSLGIKLIYGLSQEIRGKINIQNANGTSIMVSFVPRFETDETENAAQSAERRLVLES